MLIYYCFCSCPTSDKVAPRKGFFISRTRPSWPSANVKLPHLIFSHLLFTAHISALVQGHCLRHLWVMCGVHLCWELRCLGACEVRRAAEAWPQGCQRSKSMRRAETSWEVSLNIRIYVCSARQGVCVSYKARMQSMTSIHPSVVHYMRYQKNPTPYLLTWGSTDAPPRSNGSCHCVMDWAQWAQLVLPALTHLPFTWGDAPPLLVCVGRWLYA